MTKPVRPTFIDIPPTSLGSVHYLKGILLDARITTLQRIEGIGQAELDWVYAPGWNSVAALLAHMTANEHYFRIEFIENRELTSDEQARWQPGQELGKYVGQFTGTPLQKYLDDLSTSRELLIEAINRIDFDTFVKKRDGYNPDTGFNQAWCLFHLAEDEVHHRGQISIIRKLYNESVKRSSPPCVFPQFTA